MSTTLYHCEKVLTDEEKAEFAEKPKPGKDTVRCLLLVCCCVALAVLPSQVQSFNPPTDCCEDATLFIAFLNFCFARIRTTIRMNTYARAQVTLTRKQLHDLCTRTRLEGGKIDMNRVLMEGLVTTEPEEPDPPTTFLDCGDALADRQIVTQLVGGEPRLSNKKKPKAQVVQQLADSVHSSTAASQGEAIGAASQVQLTEANTQEARREKALRMEKLQKEQARAAAGAIAIAEAAAAAAAGTPGGIATDEFADHTSPGIGQLASGAFDGVD